MNAPDLAHSEMQDLVAAYALDSVDDAERNSVEQHLATCPRCRAELAAHQETAALLAFSGGQAPDEVWDRISDAVTGSSGAGTTARPVLSFAPGVRRRVAYWATAAVGTAAAAAVAVLGVTVAHQSQRLDNLAAATRAQATLRQAVAAALQPGSRNRPLTSPDGSVVADVVLTARSTGYLIADRFRSLPDDRTYQLWAIVGDTPVSLGLLGPDPTVLVFRAVPRATVLAVTDERAGGAPRPTGKPVASAPV